MRERVRGMSFKGSEAREEKGERKEEMRAEKRGE